MMNSKGFTLLELVVIVAIIATLSAVILGGYNTGETKFTLVRSANKLAQDLRKAENMALTGKSAPESFGEVFPRGGYGLYFEASTTTDANSYIFFCDCNNNKEYDASGSAASCASSTATTTYPEASETLSLETSVNIIDVSPTNALHITFYPPDPIIKIVGSDSQRYDEATITLDLHGETKTITINTVGLIDID